MLAPAWFLKMTWTAGLWKPAVDGSSGKIGWGARTAVAPVWAAARGIAYHSFAELTSHPEVRAEVERTIAALNERVSRVESIRKWTILPAEWTAESEELTPTLKLKRRVILQKYAPAINEMYGDADPFS